VARELGVLKKLFPYLQVALSRREAEICATLDNAAREKENLPQAQQVALMLAALGTFLGGRGTLQILDDLNIRTLDGYDVRLAVRQLVNDRKRVSDWFRQGDVPDREFRFLAARILPGLPILMFRLARARGDYEAADWFIKKMESLGIAAAPPAPLLMGRHLLEMGASPGPKIGEITRRVYFLQLSGEITNFEEAQSATRE
jgi:tRNA nucleotidyltransferase (CCA-adding enzyme)